MAYKQNNNPLSTPILKVEMDNNVMGKANKDGSIHINKNISDPKEIQDIVEHESVHLDQMQRGDLDYDDNNVIWKGKKYSRNDMKEGAKNLPWEKEAYQKTEGSKEFKLNSHRGNNNSYQSFQDKGLISPLNQNPPPFKFKDLFKNKVTTQLQSRDIGADPAGTGVNTPKLFTNTDSDWLAAQNEEQRNKSIGGGFVGITQVPGELGESGTSTSGNVPRANTGGQLNSLTPGKGFDLSAKSDQTANNNPNTSLFDTDDWATYMADSTVSTENQEAYANDTNFQWRDEWSTPGVTTDQQGYYNVSTGEKAPDVDISANLKNLSDQGKVLEPASYNIYGDNDAAGIGQSRDRETANTGNYTTNYKFASQPKILRDQEFYEGQDSKALTKGIKTKTLDKPKSNKPFSKAQYRTGSFFRDPSKVKLQKTILPKRKITYSTRLSADGKNIETTATKRFDRKKYDTSTKYFSNNQGNRKLVYDGRGDEGAKKSATKKEKYIAAQKRNIDTRNQNLQTVRNLQTNDRDWP